jgi:PadR family transcriptional regulator PadR
MNFLTTSALLDSVVLSLLNQSDSYGYILTQDVIKTLEVSESTLYPALRRLQKTGDLETYDQTENGRNRRYYKITSSGKEKLKDYLAQWEDAKKKLNSIFENAKGKENVIPCKNAEYSRGDRPGRPLNQQESNDNVERSDKK